jgi:putative membrane protein
MNVGARDHVPALTGLLTVVSLALVFGAAGGIIPAAVLPTAPDSFFDAVPHVNAAISTVAIAVILHGWWRIRRGEVDRHARSMVAGFGLFGLFLALYLYKVAVKGTQGFDGPAAVETFLYLPTLAIHMLLAVVCIPLLFYVLLVGLTHSTDEIPRTRHRRIGRIAAPLWLISFALGNVVYLLLYVVY